MTASFDIFQMEPEGAVCWLGVADTLEEAKVRIQQLTAAGKSGFVIMDHATGNKLVVPGSQTHSNTRPKSD